jgi:peptidoglycan-associated lipoprotein
MYFDKKILASFALAALLSSCSDTVSENSTTGANTSAAESDFISHVGPNGDRVFFGYDKSDITAEGQQVLTHQSMWLNSNPGQKVSVEGHADVRGSEAYNMGLGERRSNSAKNYLVALGVSPDRLEVVSYGKSRPAVLGNDETAHAQNRRAVTVAH